MAVPTGSAPTPAVSVAVSTYRRAHLLPRLVAALESQTMAAELELVILDDASGDSTEAVLRGLAITSAIPITVLVAATNGGPAVGRNLAWRASRAPIIAFTDDDCVPSPTWLEAGVAACAPGNLIVGRTQPAPDQLADEGPFSRTLRVEDARFMQTCNVFYRRTDLERLDGFAESFRTGEDTDLGMRAIEAGLQAKFVPGALVSHDVRPSDLFAKLRESRSWIDLPLVVRRHPATRRAYLYRRLFWKRSHPFVILAWSATVLAVIHPLGLLAMTPWVWLRLVREPLTKGWRGRIATLPGAFLVDSTEVVTMARGSWRHRSLVL